MKAGLFITSLTATFVSLILILKQNFNDADFNHIIYIILLFILLCQSIIGVVATYRDLVILFKKIIKSDRNILEKNNKTNSLI